MKTVREEAKRIITEYDKAKAEGNTDMQNMIAGFAVTLVRRLAEESNGQETSGTD